MKNSLLALSFLFLLSTGCKNDLEIVGQQEEVIVIYGLLNLNDSVQYIKINKGFASTEVAPITLAQDPDNLFFDSLEVRLIDRTNGISVDCEKVYMEKQSGTFSSAVNYVYGTDLPLTAGHQYEIRVRNLLNGQEAKSSIQLISDPTPKSPNSLNINSYPIEPDKLMTIDFEADPRLATVYEIKMNFVYEEINTQTNTSDLDTVSWVIARGKFGDNKRIFLRTQGFEFYDFLASAIPQKGSEIQRKGKFLMVEYWTGDSELSSYMDVYGTSSIGVVQKKNDYTNIEGGYGIFASRNRYVITGDKLDVRIMTQLTTNPKLTKFNFVN
ncbi:MAG: DUF4249 domain-containing protein [Bacteroidota bacterium]|nr:DUF4249 domain-containing protein [Bacteroidota bacterium]MDX5430932.1 DUF4249 domain-containing protein [Bacteroidota bacterium]MDX5469680.1 DUF4249 domain-containing protein [Bacteroidota bacterium]